MCFFRLCLSPPSPTNFFGFPSFKQSFSAEELEDKQKASTKKKESFEEAQKRKKEKKAAEIAAAKKGQQQKGGGTDQPDFTKVDIRVGKIIKVWNHETADKLFCEQIDVGGEDVGETDGPREIASGLRGHYTLEEMQDKLVLVVCNLKAAKIVGFVSNGMVLAAKVRFLKEMEEEEEKRCFSVFVFENMFCFVFFPSSRPTHSPPPPPVSLC